MKTNSRTSRTDNAFSTKPPRPRPYKVDDHSTGEAITEPNNNTPALIEEDEHYLESPSKRKCPRCKQQLIHRTCGTAKFGKHIVLVSYDYCPIHGQPPVTKHQLKL